MTGCTKRKKNIEEMMMLLLLPAKKFQTVESVEVLQVCNDEAACKTSTPNGPSDYFYRLGFFISIVAMDDSILTI